MFKRLIESINKFLDRVEELIMPTPTKDILYEAVDEDNMLTIKFLLKNKNKNLLNRCVAYQHAIDLGRLKIAYEIRKSYTEQ